MNKPVLTINEVAEHYSVSVSTIREWVRKGYIDPKLSEAQKSLAKKLGLPLNEDEEDDELDLLDNDK
jgi:uncharacterized protein YjcR